MLTKESWLINNFNFHPNKTKISIYYTCIIKATKKYISYSIKTVPTIAWGTFISYLLRQLENGQKLTSFVSILL